MQQRGRSHCVALRMLRLCRCWCWSCCAPCVQMPQSPQLCHEADHMPVTRSLAAACSSTMPTQSTEDNRATSLPLSPHSIPSQWEWRRQRRHCSTSWVSSLHQLPPTYPGNSLKPVGFSSRYPVHDESECCLPQNSLTNGTEPTPGTTG